MRYILLSISMQRLACISRLKRACMLTGLLVLLASMPMTSQANPPLRIAEAWAAHNDVLVMLGAGEQIVATSLTERSRPWLFRVAPAMRQALLAFPQGALSQETLFMAKPDLVFVSQYHRTASVARKLGFPVVEVGFNDYDSLRACIVLTAQHLGGDAQRRKDRYLSDFDAALKTISARVAAIPPANRPRVLHIASAVPLTVDGRDTMIDAWINAAGGINAAADIKGSLQPIGIEQLAALRPDVIIVSGAARRLLQTQAQPPVWQHLEAVRQGRVVVNPEGVFPWARYGSESLLQLYWAAKTLHPDMFADIDIAEITRDFYQRYFDYTLSHTEVQAILNAAPPPPVSDHIQTSKEKARR